MKTDVYSTNWNCRGIEKADAERMVHTIWRSKADFEASNDVSISLADYLYVYLNRKHGTPKVN